MKNNILLPHTAHIFPLVAGMVLLLSSCSLFPSILGYNKGFGNAGGFYAGHYDDNGIPIYGHENGRPVYGYTQAGQPIHAFKQLYAGCFVPNWGSADAHYPQGVRYSSRPPRLNHNSAVSPNSFPYNAGNY